MRLWLPVRRRPKPPKRQAGGFRYLGVFANLTSRHVSLPCLPFSGRSVLPSDFNFVARCREAPCSRKHLQYAILQWHASEKSGYLLGSDEILIPASAYCGRTAGFCWNLGHQFAVSWDEYHVMIHSPQNVLPESRSHNAEIGNIPV